MPVVSGRSFCFCVDLCVVSIHLLIVWGEYIVTVRVKGSDMSDDRGTGEDRMVGGGG
jgi:hypothetical protein